MVKKKTKKVAKEKKSVDINDTAALGKLTLREIHNIIVKKRKQKEDHENKVGAITEELKTLSGYLGGDNVAGFEEGDLECYIDDEGDFTISCCPKEDQKYMNGTPSKETICRLCGFLKKHFG